MIWLIFYKDQAGTPRLHRVLDLHCWSSIAQIAEDLEANNKWSVTEIRQHIPQVLTHAKEA